MDNKERLLEDCGSVVARLLADGCDRVVILWDERPAWPEMGEPLCWHNERLQVIAELKKAKVSTRKAHLVCIEREFESWLLFDKAMLSSALSRSTHKVSANPPRHPDRIENPKGAMMNLFDKCGAGRYIDTQAARRFANGLSDLNRLRKCATFQRFEKKIFGGH